MMPIDCTSSAKRNFTFDEREFRIQIVFCYPLVFVHKSRTLCVIFAGQRVNTRNVGEYGTASYLRDLSCFSNFEVFIDRGLIFILDVQRVFPAIRQRTVFSKA